MLNLKHSIILIILTFYSCTQNIKKFADNSEVEDLLNLIKNSKYSYLVRYLFKEPSLVAINPDPSIECSVINFEKKTILVPRKDYIDLNLKSTYVAKSLYEYYIRTKFNIIEEIPFELKLLSAYFEIEYLINHSTEETIKEIKNNELGKKVCYYLIGEDSFEKIIREEEDKPNKVCKRPSFELKHYIEILKKLKKSLNDIDSKAFFTVINEIEMDKAKRGEVSIYDAYKNYYYFTSKPEMELYRDIRKDIFSKIRSFNSFNSFYKSEIKKFKKNRKILEKNLTNFNYCLEIK